MRARDRVADLWDEVVAKWVPGQDSWPQPLDRWRNTYRGRGPGAIDLGQYPDPWVGDLRGLESEPRLIVLGLNPGIGYDQLQGATGTWTERVQREGYSRCLERSPAEDPSSWIAVHSKQSPYWVRLEKFAQRWLDDPASGHQHILNFELYPWHSPQLTAGITSPPDVVQEFVLAPIAEIGVGDVFAFGAPWFQVAEGLALPLLADWSREGDPWPSEFGNWTVHVYELPIGQRLVVSRQPGYSGAPGPARLEQLRERLAAL